MHFRFLPLFLSALSMLAQPAQAQETSAKPASTTSKKPVTVNKSESATQITADTLESKQGKVVEAKGDAEIRKDDQLIRADQLKYNQDTEEVFADGAVRIENKGASVAGPSLKMNMKENVGVMVQPAFSLTEGGVRGNAETMRIEGKNVYSFQKASYTSCPIGNDDWLLKMGELELDRNTQIGTAYNARIEYLGVPILYTPWMNFPLNDQRRSGFLGPILGSSNTGGKEVTIPFYWNIASNYDATFSPRFIEKRGNLYDNEFRYMGNSYSGKLEYGELLKDKLALRDRSHSSLVHTQNFGAGFTGALNLNEASDDAYFRDLSPNPSIALQKHLLREAAVNYSGGWWTATARAQSYQTWQDPIAPIVTPYRRLPQINLGAQRVLGGAVTSFSAEYVDFNHPTLINGRRTVVYPTVSYPLFNDPAYYLTPKLGVHSTQYLLGDNNPATETRYDRSLPIFSLDSGMTLERDLTLGENEYIQTLEPRIYYVSIPYRNQDLLPNFDTSAATFSFMQMFTENRFLGSDRIGDADQITTALTSRLLDSENGNERLRVAVGQRFSQQTPRVILGVPTATTNQSDILIGVSGRMTPALSLNGLSQYNPNESRTEAFSATARYLPEAGKVLNLGYRYTFSADPDPTKTLKQVDVSTQWLLTGRWNMVGKVAYSLQETRTVEALAGFEYNQDCWTVRFVGQQFVTATNTNPVNYFLQLELRELIRVGTDPLSALKQNIPGYTIMTEQPRNKPAPSTP